MLLNKEGAIDGRDGVSFDQRSQCGLSSAQVILYENKVWYPNLAAYDFF